MGGGLGAGGGGLGYLELWVEDWELWRLLVVWVDAVARVGMFF